MTNLYKAQSKNSLRILNIKLYIGIIIFYKYQALITISRMALWTFNKHFKGAKFKYILTHDFDKINKWACYVWPFNPSSKVKLSKKC